MYKQLTALIVVTFIVGCGQPEVPEPPEPLAQSAESVASAPDTPSPPEQAAPRTLEEHKAALETRYLLRPDQRFMRALPEMEKIVAGEASAPPETRFEQGTWQVKVGEDTVPLPRFPDFPDLFALLLKKAQSLVATIPEAGEAPQERLADIESKLNQYLTISCPRAVQEADALWREGFRGPRVTQAAARGLIGMAQQHYDPLWQSEPILTQALAAFALARAQEPGCLLPEEALLASQLGYGGHARKVARQLPEAHPVRLYVLQQDVELLEQALSPEAAARTKLLAVRRVGDQNNLALLNKMGNVLFPQNYLQPAVLGLFTPEVSAQAEGFLAALTVLLLVEDTGQPDYLRPLLREARDLPAGEEEQAKSVMAISKAILERGDGLVASFEQGLAALPGPESGPYLNADLQAAWYRNTFISAIHRNGMHSLDFLGSAESALQFAEEVEGMPGDTLDEWVQWYRLGAEQEQGGHVGAALMEGLKGGKYTGTMLMLLYDWCHAAFSQTERQQIKLVPILAAQLDSRIDYRTKMAYAGRNHGHDINRSDALYESVIAQAGEDRLTQRAWWLHYHDDIEGLYAMLAETHPVPAPSLSILGYLEVRKDHDQDRVREAYEKLGRVFPESRTVAQQYADYLKEQNDLEGLRACLRKWLSLGLPAAGLSHTSLKNRIAFTYYDEGNYKRALEEMGWDGSATSMNLVMRCNLKLGNKRVAQDMMRRILDRYGDYVANRGNVAYYHWFYKEYEKAAQVLRELPFNISVGDWQYILAEDFYEAFKEQPEEEMSKAIEALRQAGFTGWYLKGLAKQFEIEDDPQSAFKLMQYLREPGVWGLILPVEAYQYLRKYEDPEVALEWLRGQIPPELSNQAAVVYQGKHHFRLLWDLIPNPEKEHTDLIWLLRLLGELREGGGQGERQEALAQYYSKESASVYDDIGRALLGTDAEKELSPLAMSSPKRLCEIAYYLGVKALGAGQLTEARDWFILSIDTGAPDQEWGWAKYEQEQLGKYFNRSTASPE